MFVAGLGPNAHEQVSSSWGLLALLLDVMSGIPAVQGGLLHDRHENIQTMSYKSSMQVLAVDCCTLLCVCT